MRKLIIIVIGILLFMFVPYFIGHLSGLESGNSIIMKWFIGFYMSFLIVGFLWIFRNHLVKLKQYITKYLNK